MVEADKTVGNGMLSGIIKTSGLSPGPTLTCSPGVFPHGPACCQGPHKPL